MGHEKAWGLLGPRQECQIRLRNPMATWHLYNDHFCTPFMPLGPAINSAIYRTRTPVLGTSLTVPGCHYGHSSLLGTRAGPHGPLSTGSGASRLPPWLPFWHLPAPVRYPSGSLSHARQGSGTCHSAACPQNVAYAG